MTNNKEMHITGMIESYNKNVEELMKKEFENKSDFLLAHKSFDRDADKIIELLIFSLITDSSSFYGQFIIRLNRKIDLMLPAPAAVTYKGLYFELIINPVLLFKTFSIKEIKAILIHEIYHVCNNHITRGKIFREKYSHHLVNVAMDLAINQFIDCLPADCVHLNNIQVFVPNVDVSKVLPNKNFEFYLEIFKETYDSDEECKEFCDKMDGKSDSQDQGSSGGEMGELKDAYERGGASTGNKLDDHNSWDEADTTAGDNESKNVLKKVYEEAKQNARGLTPAGIEQAIRELFTPPTISWQQLLKKYVGSTPVPFKNTITRKDRRQPHRADILGRIEDHMVDVVVAIDTSGSMGDDDVMYALSEVCDIVKNIKSRVTVIECDTKIQKEYVIKTKKDIQTRVKGRGGTVFTPIFEYMCNSKRKNSICIFFTDGGGESYIDKKYLKHYRTLWVLTDENYSLSVKNLPKHHSEVKFIDREHMKKKNKK